MKVLLFGAGGQVGGELCRTLASFGDVLPLARHGAEELVGDLQDVDGIVETVRRTSPDLIVNAAAYTAVDRAESEVAEAVAVNATAPGVLAREAALRGAWLVHFSTDYVFDGAGDSPWKEDDATGPLNVYGRTKLAGEEGIRTSGARHLILRTSWVYGSAGSNFPRTMMRLAAERDRLRVVSDQYGAPTGARLLATVTVEALRKAIGRADRGGTYHVAAGGETSWHSYATYVIEAARRRGDAIRVPRDAIEAVMSSEFAAAAVRPRNSRLDTRKFRSVFGVDLPDWRVGVDELMSTWMAGQAGILPQRSSERKSL